MHLPARLSFVAFGWLLACAAPALPPAAPCPAEAPSARPAAGAVAELQAPALGADEDAPGDPGPIPVTAADPAWGAREAPVTIVEFGDLECPFCQRAGKTLDELAREYGPSRLRIVWKHNPLSFHERARPAATIAAALFERGGNEWFWGYQRAVLSRTGRDFDPVDAARFTGLSESELETMLVEPAAAAKVDEDVALAKRIGANGTPVFFVNGVHVAGAQPIEKFRAVIDAQARKARELAASGVPASLIYARATEQSFELPKPPESKPAEVDTATWRVPVAGSPLRGKATAPVTLVVFSDFQCPFCAKLSLTLARLETEYGGELRIVFKHNPLSFHERAEPAAELAIEARTQKGEAAFWRMHDALFAPSARLEERDLEDLAAAAGLRVGAVREAIAKKKHAAVIAADQDLADELEVKSAPQCFVNGRRITGAQPIERFRALIDEQLVAARDLIKKGTPPAKVYDALQKGAKSGPTLETKVVPAPTGENPSRGPNSAKVTLQVFGDFRCPFCKRLAPTLDELEAAFPGKLRIVWRHRPLPMHEGAGLAAEASMEAFAQRGSRGFWKMASLLFEAQGSPLDRAAADAMARLVGLDMAKWSAALDAGTHRAAIEADIAIAERADIAGTPATVINGYFVQGTQPLSSLRKVVARALSEAR